jgi:polar amino acid transport system substrate-binding protein
MWKAYYSGLIIKARQCVIGLFKLNVLANIYNAVYEMCQNIFIMCKTMTAISRLGLVMALSVNFIVVSLLLTTFTTQAQCRKTVPLINDNLLHTKSTNELLNNRDLVLLKRALANLDCQMNFVMMPWARAIVELKNGRIDILNGAFKTAQRQRFAWYSDFSFDSFGVLFMRKEDIDKYPIKNLQDIAKYKLRIGTQISAIYSDDFSKLLTDKSFSSLVFPNSSREALWNMLKINRIDAFISELSSGLNELESLKLNDQIGPTDFVVSTQTAHFIFSKKSVDNNFVKAVDRELEKLRKSNTITPH